MCCHFSPNGLSCLTVPVLTSMWRWTERNEQVNTMVSLHPDKLLLSSLSTTSFIRLRVASIVRFSIWYSYFLAHFVVLGQSTHFENLYSDQLVCAKHSPGPQASLTNLRFRTWRIKKVLENSHFLTTLILFPFRPILVQALSSSCTPLCQHFITLAYIWHNMMAVGFANCSEALNIIGLDHQLNKLSCWTSWRLWLCVFQQFQCPWKTFVWHMFWVGLQEYLPQRKLPRIWQLYKSHRLNTLLKFFMMLLPKRFPAILLNSTNDLDDTPSSRRALKYLGVACFNVPQLFVRHLIHAFLRIMKKSFIQSS